MDTATLLWGLIFGCVGLGYFMYGKKQSAIMPVISGVLLMVVPYFISNNYLLVVTGIALIAIPYFVRL